jgi:hypothetical protein
VLELCSTEAALIACHADGAVLDRLTAPPGNLVARIAPDEAWLIGARADRTGLARQADALVGGSAAGLAVDQTDGWAIWSIRGAPPRDVLNRLMIAPIPATATAFVQGAITGVPGKVLLDGDVAHLMVPAPVGHHLRDRIMEVCRDLSPAIGSPRPFVLFAGVSGRC